MPAGRGSRTTDLATTFSQMNAHARLDVRQHERVDGRLVPLPGDAVTNSARGFEGTGSVLYGTVGPSGTKVRDLYGISAFGRSPVNRKSVDVAGWSVVGDPYLREARYAREDTTRTQRRAEQIGMLVDGLEHRAEVTAAAVLYGVWENPASGDAVLVAQYGGSGLGVGVVATVTDDIVEVLVPTSDNEEPDRVDAVTLGDDPLVRAPSERLGEAMALAERYLRQVSAPLDAYDARDTWVIQRRQEQTTAAQAILARVAARAAG